MLQRVIGGKTLDELSIVAERCGDATHTFFRRQPAFDTEVQDFLAFFVLS